ncbi:transmembrane protein, putative [Medicago truncatula]|uniref:Transmembrane protein, putative n=1 Tax=Medicago truncatula TaxID=3880 RepID=A0A072U6Q5_MEDTR|nr:transmembrane protein, putative [Medicago truncatula]
MEFSSSLRFLLITLVLFKLLLRFFSPIFYCLPSLSQKLLFSTLIRRQGGREWLWLHECHTYLQGGLGKYCL